MTKALLLSLVIIMAVACSRKTAATKEPVIPQRESSISPIPTPVNATPVVTAPSVATDAATISVGKTVFETKCGRCHGLKNVAAYTEQRWDGILRLMAPKARLTETETQQVAAYVKANAKK